MTNDKQAESAARKIWRRVDSIKFPTLPNVSEIKTIISAEYEPVMEVLRDAWHQRHKVVKHTINIEAGNYLTCLICMGESPGGKPLVDEIAHDVNCWVSRAHKILENQ